MAIYDLGNELDKERFKRRCNSLYQQGKIVELVERKKKRSLNQNALLHVWFAIIADEIGCTPEEAKRDLKRLYGGMIEYESPITGRKEYRDWNTSGLSMEQMSTFLNWLASWSLEFGIYLPEEGSVGYEEAINRYYN